MLIAYTEQHRGEKHGFYQSNHLHPDPGPSHTSHVRALSHRALTGAAFLFILLAYWRKSVTLEQAAYAKIALASIGTIVAGITGTMDNIKNYDGGAPNAGTKIVLAIVLLIITATISIVRYRNPDLFQKANPILYAASYGASFVIALVLAFLGGIILYGF